MVFIRMVNRQNLKKPNTIFIQNDGRDIIIQVS